MRRAITVVIAALLAACGGDGGGDDRSGDNSAAEADTTTATVQRSTAAEVPLVAGQCGTVPRLQVGAPLDPATITNVPCTEPHAIEVGAVFDYPAGSDLDFPGTASVDGYATDQCVQRFEGYVGAPYATSSLDVLIVAPDEEGWADGDRRIACVLYHFDFQPLTQTVAGSGL